ncbi:hypothetical protein [Streptomyces sp. NPDC048637]|uniref:hypothetical protein n=1 Tax=Streptomyces sp. NPDC048637 TaxID=3155636 RepID=UPI00343F46EB
MRSLLLPEFEQLVHLARLQEVHEDLNWVREEVEPGTVHAADLEAALDRFLTHAPYLIAATRRADAKPLAAQDAVLLDRFETLLTTRPQSDGDARSGLKQGSADDAMALWLELGQNLIEAVRATTIGSAKEPSRPAATASTPPKPPAAATTAGRSR